MLNAAECFLLDRVYKDSKMYNLKAQCCFTQAKKERERETERKRHTQRQRDQRNTLSSGMSKELLFSFQLCEIKLYFIKSKRNISKLIINAYNSYRGYFKLGLNYSVYFFLKRRKKQRIFPTVAFLFENRHFSHLNEENYSLFLQR